MWKKIGVYLVAIAIPLGVGALSAFLTMDQMENYAALRQPPLSPPGALFPIVWTILFVLMGIGSAMVFLSRHSDKAGALTVYGLQLVVNFFWTILFFNLGERLLALFWIILLIALVVWMIARFYKINKTAAYLQLPYLAWLLFATYLNAGVWLLNR